MLHFAPGSIITRVSGDAGMGPAVLIGSTNLRIQRLTFIFNQITGGQDAIRVIGQGTDWLTIEGKDIRECSRYGIFIDNTASNVTNVSQISITNLQCGKIGIYWPSLDDLTKFHEGNKIETGVVSRQNLTGIKIGARVTNLHLDTDISWAPDEFSPETLLDFAGTNSSITIRGADFKGAGGGAYIAKSVYFREGSANNLLFLSGATVILRGLVDEGTNNQILSPKSKNHAKNPHFVHWAEGIPVDWSVSDGVKISPETELVRDLGETSVRMSSVESFGKLFQVLPEYLDGKTVNISAWVKALPGPVVCQCMSLQFSSSQIFTGGSVVIPEDGLWHFIGATIDLPRGVGPVEARIHVSNEHVGGELVIDSVAITAGKQPSLP